MKKLALYLLVATLVTACTKSLTQTESCKEGFIIWGGTPAADGLGWYFSENKNSSGKAYKFDNLPEAYQKDKLAVRLCFYETAETYACFCAVPMPLYHITTIEERDESN